MKVTIIETKKAETLNIIDPKSGMDWTNDLLGNHGGLPEYNDETDSYHMTQESFNWWNNLIEKYEAADYRCFEIKSMLSEEQEQGFDSGLQEVLNCDLEDMPGYMNDFCDEWESGHK
jgi:hypothetical protein